MTFGRNKALLLLLSIAVSLSASGGVGSPACCFLTIFENRPPKDPNNAGFFKDCVEFVCEAGVAILIWRPRVLISPEADARILEADCHGRLAFA